MLVGISFAAAASSIQNPSLTSFSVVSENSGLDTEKAQFSPPVYEALVSNKLFPSWPKYQIKLLSIKLALFTPNARVTKEFPFT